MSLNSNQVITSLDNIATRFEPVLENNSYNVIEKAKAMVRSSKARFQQNSVRRQGAPTGWGFRINPSDPLKFKETVIDKIRLRVDMFVESYWDTHPATKPTVLNVAIRVWCLNPQMYFRPNWDAAELEDKIDPNCGRAMMRFHFDQANPNQQGPKHHLQIGGTQHVGEMGWLPESLSVPRFLHMPVDLVLAVEIVTATFYPTYFGAISRNIDWKGFRNTSQVHLLRDYFNEAKAAVDREQSVLETLWN